MVQAACDLTLALSSSSFSSYVMNASRGVIFFLGYSTAFVYDVVALSFFWGDFCGDITCLFDLVAVDFK